MGYKKVWNKHRNLIFQKYKKVVKQAYFCKKLHSISEKKKSWSIYSIELYLKAHDSVSDSGYSVWSCGKALILQNKSSNPPRAVYCNSVYNNL